MTPAPLFKIHDAGFIARVGYAMEASRVPPDIEGVATAKCDRGPSPGLGPRVLSPPSPGDGIADRLVTAAVRSLEP